jgi:hypothetical protein
MPWLFSQSSSYVTSHHPFEQCALPCLYTY